LKFRLIPEAFRRARLFSPRTLERKIEALFPGERGGEARRILARADAISGFWRPETAASNRLAIKLRALYLSGPDLAALGRALDLAAEEHREFDMVTETAARYESEWPGTRDQVRDAPDGRPAYEQLLAWLEH
jgi:hypothetical protein